MRAVGSSHYSIFVLYYTRNRVVVLCARMTRSTSGLKYYINIRSIAAYLRVLVRNYVAGTWKVCFEDQERGLLTRNSRIRKTRCDRLTSTHFGDR